MHCHPSAGPKSVFHKLPALGKKHVPREETYVAQLAELAKAATTSCLVLVGGSGLGKSSLAVEVAHKVNAEGWCDPPACLQPCA